MLSPYDWWLTGKVLFHLARFWPDLKNPSAPLYPLPERLGPWAQAGPYPVRCERPPWGWATVPAGAESKLPVVIFSGGAAADGTNYELLIRHWASHGVAVLEPHHRDAFSHHSDRHGESWRTWKGAIWDAWGLALRDPHIWRHRIHDITQLLDRLSICEHELGVQLDGSKVAVAGYSYGAQVALLLGGTQFPHRGRLLCWRDPRVRAAVAISPEAGGGLAPGRVDSTLSIPTLFLTGDADRDVRGRGWRAKAAVFRRAPAGDKWLALLHGANHFAFTGRLFEAARSPEELAAQASLFGASKALTTLFLSQHLRQDEEAGSRLTATSRNQSELLHLWSK